MGLFGRFFDWLADALALSTAERAERDVSASNVLTQQSAHDEASIEKTRSLLDADPENVELKDWYAFQLYCNRRYMEALRYYEELLQVSEPRPEHYYYTGSCLFALGRRERAIGLWSELVQRFPDRTVAAKARAKLERLGITDACDGT